MKSMSVWISLILFVGFVGGCYELDVIQVTIDEPIEESGYVTGKYDITFTDGQEVTGIERFHVIVVGTQEGGEPPADPVGDLVWLTPSGTKFHWREECRWTGSGNGSWVEKESAIADGKLPCSICQRREDEQ